MAGRYMKAPPDAALADKAAARARTGAAKAARRGGGGGERSAEGEGGRDFRRYTSPGGFQVLLGRSSRQNDELTMRVASHGDVWMHAR